MAPPCQDKVKQSKDFAIDEMGVPVTVLPEQLKKLREVPRYVLAGSNQLTQLLL